MLMYALRLENHAIFKFSLLLLRKNILFAVVFNQPGCVSGSTGRSSSFKVPWEAWPLLECLFDRLIINSLSPFEVHDSAEIDIETPIE